MRRPRYRRLRRVEVVDVTRWEAERADGRRPAPPLVVLDVEPWVAHWRTGQRELDDAVAALARRWGAQRVHVVTNSARLVTTAAVPAGWQQTSVARKPFTRLRVPAGSVVVGDMPLQDGLLAWRLRATFVRVPLAPDAPAWARLLHRAFTPVSRLWLRAG